MAYQRIWDVSGVPLETPRGKYYDEKAFRYFLSIERQRAARTNRSFLLLKVSALQGRGLPGRIASEIATRLWPVLWDCVREVDFVGWYRAGQVAGAVLSQGTQLAVRDEHPFIRDRVLERLHQQLPAREAGGLDVRVLHVRPTLRKSSDG